MMHLANGGWAVFVFIVVVLLTALVLFAFYRKTYLIRSLFSRNQQEFLLSNLNQPARLLRTFALLLALYFIAFSALDPRWGTKNVQADIEGIDIVFIMDISRSMLTPDAVPNRLEASKRLSVQLMNLLLGSRIGITAFAGYAFNVIPLTTDVNAAALFLNELSPDMMDVQGTNLEDAIKKALELFEKEALTHKAIVIFTDGEDYEFSPLNQVRLAREKGIAIFTVGVGTPNGGSIPLFDANGNQVDFLKKDGQVVVSKLNDKLLAQIAAETHGIYVYGNENSIITLSKRLDEIKKSRFGSNLYEFMEPQFQYFLVIGLLLLFIYLLLPDRKMPGSAVSIVIAVLLLSFGGRAFSSDASSGCREYKKGNYDQALEYFQRSIVKDPANEKVRFNEGDALLKLKKNDDSIRAFGGLIRSKDRGIRGKSLYNLGNAYLEKGDVTNAVMYYRSVLENEKPGSKLYKKALNNLLFAKRMPPQQQQQQQQNDRNKQDQDKKQEPGKQDRQKDKDKQNRPDQQPQAEPVSPSQVENLLNLIEEEEKKHIGKKERDKTVRVYPQNEW